jgi:hypothetical protein
MKEIKLTQGKVAFVDDEDFDYLNQWRWQFVFNGYTWYAHRSEYTNGKKTIRMHRLIMNAPKGVFIDHIDHNGLNNQKSNLRVCTRSENSQNRLNKHRIQYKGVEYKPTSFKRYKNGKTRISLSKKPYYSSIRVKMKKIYLGRFKTSAEAAIAYNNAALKYFGEFAKLNLIIANND